MGNPTTEAGEQELDDLRQQLQDDPNDADAFDRLAGLLCAHGVAPARPGAGRDDVTWALAEEVAQNQRAWYPLLEMARLSVGRDLDAAVRFLGTAAEREPTGVALATGLRLLREGGHPNEAVNLGVAYWRPAGHDPEAGRQLVEAAFEAGRQSEARRHLEALSRHPDVEAVARVQQELAPRAAAGGTDFTTSRADGAVVVTVTGDLDLAVVGDLRAAAAEAVTERAPLVLDLTGVPFIDSVSLGALIGIHRQVSAVDAGPLRVVATAPAVLRVFSITGADGMVAVHPSLEEALAGVR